MEQANNSQPLRTSINIAISASPQRTTATPANPIGATLLALSQTLRRFNEASDADLDDENRKEEENSEGEEEPRSGHRNNDSFLSRSLISTLMQSYVSNRNPESNSLSDIRAISRLFNFRRARERADDDDSDEDIRVETASLPSDVEEEEFDIAKEIKNAIGKLGVEVFVRIKRKNTLNLKFESKFMEKFFEKFITSLADCTNNPDSAKEVKNFVKTLPSIIELGELYEKYAYDQRSECFMVILHQFYDYYLNIFDAPLYEEYRKDFLPFSKKLFTYLKPDTIAKVKEMMKKHETKLKELNLPISRMITQQDFVKHYAKVKKNIIGKTQGMKSSIFII